MVNRNARRRDNAMVELPLALLPFAFVFAGFVDIVHVGYLVHGIEQRVRVGARYASAHGADVTSVRNMVLYNSPSIPAGAQPFLGLQPTDIQVIRHSTDTLDDRVEVSVSGLSIPLVSPWLRRTLNPGPIRSVAASESLGNSN
jgi:hypothetical protein